MAGQLINLSSDKLLRLSGDYSDIDIPEMHNQKKRKSSVVFNADLKLFFNVFARFVHAFNNKTDHIADADMVKHHNVLAGKART